mmetsp:Transcript_17010/g.40581  ORF Transcript_17010/g.40581 Transcript_17010/m.40581 type:complete len:353 (+) Transcript_17010:1324-2382(+)
MGVSAAPHLSLLVRSGTRRRCEAARRTWPRGVRALRQPAAHRRVRRLRRHAGRAHAARPRARAGRRACGAARARLREDAQRLLRRRDARALHPPRRLRLGLTAGGRRHRQRGGSHPRVLRGEAGRLGRPESCAPRPAGPRADRSRRADRRRAGALLRAPRRPLRAGRPRGPRRRLAAALTPHLLGGCARRASADDSRLRRESRALRAARDGGALGPMGGDRLRAGGEWRPLDACMATCDKPSSARPSDGANAHDECSLGERHNTLMDRHRITRDGAECLDGHCPATAERDGFWRLRAVCDAADKPRLPAPSGRELLSVARLLLGTRVYSTRTPGILAHKDATLHCASGRLTL